MLGVAATAIWLACALPAAKALYWSPPLGS
jgi:hypothetical protein